MTTKTYRILRDIFIVVGIIGGFLLWLILPNTIKNTTALHVGNGAYGSKWGILLVLPFPLFSLLIMAPKTEYFGSDEEYIAEKKKEEKETQMRVSMFFALALSLLVIGIISMGFIL